MFFFYFICYNFLGENMKKKYITNIQLYITLIYVVALLISNLISSRQVLFFGKFELTGAVIIFPITYILSDIISEVFGYKWSRKTCYMAFIANMLLAIIGYIVCILPYPNWWNDSEAFNIVLKAVPRITIASLVAFLIGDLLNDIVFQKMKGDTHKGYGLRAIVSSLVGELFDSAIFIPLAFLGSMPNNVLLKMIFLQVIFKVSYEIILLPINSIVMKKIDIIHNKELDSI